MLIDTVQVHITNEEVKTTWDYIKDYSFLITLILGAILGFGVQKINEWLKFRKTRKYFFYCLFDLKKSVQEQIKLLKAHIDNIIQTQNNNVPSLPINMGFDLRSINAVPDEDLYKIFVVKGNKKDKYYISDLSILLKGFNKIQSSLDYSQRNYNTLHKSNERCLNNFIDLLEKLLNENNKLQAEYDNLAVNTNLKKLLDKINQLVIRFDKSRDVKVDTSVFKYMNEFIYPLKEILSKYKSDLLSHQVASMEHCFYELKAIRESYTNMVKVDIDDLNVFIEHYNILINNYSKYLDKQLLIKENELDKIRKSKHI